jgi:hypothetical protein
MGGIYFRLLCRTSKLQKEPQALRKEHQSMKFLKFFFFFAISYSDPHEPAAVSYILPRSMATQGIVREENSFRIREGRHEDSILNDVSPLLLLLKHMWALIAIDTGQESLKTET